MRAKQRRVRPRTNIERSQTMGKRDGSLGSGHWREARSSCREFFAERYRIFKQVSRSAKLSREGGKISRGAPLFSELSRSTIPPVKPDASHRSYEFTCRPKTCPTRW